MNQKTAEYQTTNTNANEAIRKQASRGLHLLKESILELLYEARLNDNEWVKASHVRTQIGMPKSPAPSDMGNASVRHMLILLRDERKVEQLKRLGPWRLTNAEFKNRNKASA